MSSTQAVLCVVWCATCCAWSYWRGMVRAARLVDKRWLIFIEQRDARVRIEVDHLVHDVLRLVESGAITREGAAFARRMVEIRRSSRPAGRPPDPTSPTE